MTFAQVWIPGVCKHERTRCIHGDEGWARMTWRGVVRRQACLICGRALDRGLPDICTVTGTPHRTPVPEEGGNENAECCASGRCEVCTPGYVWGQS